MVFRLPFLPMIMSTAVILASLSGLPLHAAPGAATINFTPPVATAKTIQVTMVMWETKSHQFNPLQQSSTITYCIERPDKFRVEMKDTKLHGAFPLTLDYNSDGKTMVTYQRGPDGSQLSSEQLPRPSWEAWPFPVSVILGGMQEVVSAVPAIRDGKSVLLAANQSPSGREESWYDPKTHLLLRMVMYALWKGKAIEFSRTEFTGWVLDAPVSPSAFVVPPSWTNHK